MADRRPTLVDHVRDELTKRITDGTYAVGDQLPNEQQIGGEFSVSRATVRDAYRALVDSGYLIRRHGTGTFVSRVPQRHALDLTLSYTAMIKAAGFMPSIRVISQHQSAADLDDQARLRLAPGAEVVVVERVRFADQHPVVYSIDRVPLELVAPALHGDLGTSLFSVLEQLRFGPRGGRAKLLPVLATQREAEHLRVDVGTPLLYFDETDFDENGLPVLASFEWHTSDVFEMWLNRHAKPTSSARVRETT